MIGIRVLLVDRQSGGPDGVRRALAESTDLHIVGTASTSAAALEMLRELNPEVICMELAMPPLDGMSLMRKILLEKPTPVLGLSEFYDQDAGFQLIQDGALEVLHKDTSAAELAAKIRVAAGVKLFSQSASTATASSPITVLRAPRLLAVAASTGGPQALQILLEGLGPHFPLPVLCVQHISAGFLGGMISWLGSQISLRVKLAEAGERPSSGTVYFAPEDHHLSLDASGHIHLDAGERVDGHRPSATVLFQAAARTFGCSAIGVLLTGMGADGAKGLLALHRTGALTVAQDEESSVVFGMARSAIELGATRQVLPLEKISAHLLAAVGQPPQQKRKPT